MKPFCLLLCLLLIFSSCNNNEKRNTSEDRNAYVPDSIKASTDAMGNPVADGRKFIRSAELKFQVQDVTTTSTNIESIVRNQGGFVTYTNLSSSIDNRETLQVSRDSSLETIYYILSNELKLRVPNRKFDSTLNAIASLVDFLDYKVIQADDVSLQLLDNQLTKKRANKTNGKTSAETEAYSKEKADDAEIADRGLSDQLRFSTISLVFSQRQSIKRSMIPNNKDIAAYTPNIFVKIWDAIKIGWTKVEDLFLFAIEMWGVILLAILAWLLFKRFSNKKNKIQNFNP
ncbi:MAG: hypothetical protein B7Y15_07130 [Bacteroidetes bacterium 24-39-8]|jgi:hypothetical protein|nr:MAG: hypothetical protein B7Y15_07130 [Bacteroidetes bacterium 24-39-8]HQS55127.1 DUF4349 domain-containing protein [Sediminibacterium sp.]